LQAAPVGITLGIDTFFPLQEMAMTHNTTDANFAQEVLKSDKPVLVDFWAPWCGPCRAIAPVIDQVAEEKKDSVRVVKVNVDENTDSPVKYGVRSIPTLVLFKDGQAIATHVGSMSKTQLDSWLTEKLGG
jgi:thioredoxin 1